MSYFGNRNVGGVKQYASGILYGREVDATTNLPVTGSASAFTQFGYFRNSKHSVEKSKSTPIYDDGNNLVTTFITAPQQGTFSIEMLEQDESVRQAYASNYGKVLQLVFVGATLTYSGTKKVVYVYPYTQLEPGHDFSPGTETPTLNLEFTFMPAKAAITVTLPGSLSATTASISATQLYYTADV